MQQEKQTPKTTETESQKPVSSRIIEETVQPPHSSYQKPQPQPQQPQQEQYQQSQYQQQEQYQYPQGQYPQSFQPTTYQQPYQPQSIAGNGTGIAAVVLGAIALFNGLCFSWTLIFGGFAIILGIIGIILGIVSISQHKKAYGNNPVPGNGKAIAGIVMSTITIFVSIAEIIGVCWLITAIDSYDYDSDAIIFNSNGNENLEDWLDRLENSQDYDNYNTPTNIL